MSFLNAGHGKLTQVSRLGMPLVNELVIGIGDKDDFNGSEPKDDGQFATYVTNPTLPVLIQALFGVPAPATPRNDLVQVFLTGVPGAEPAAERQAGRDAAAEHQHRARAARGTEPRGRVGRRPGRLPERAAARATTWWTSRCARSKGSCCRATPPAIEGLNDGALSTATIAYTPDGAITRRPAFALFRPSFPYLQTPLSGSARSDAPVVGTDCRWRLVRTVDGSWYGLSMEVGSSARRRPLGRRRVRTGAWSPEPGAWSPS